MWALPSRALLGNPRDCASEAPARKRKRAPTYRLTEADRADHRIDTGAGRRQWPLLRNGDVPFVRVKSLDGLADRHLYWPAALEDPSGSQVGSAYTIANARYMAWNRARVAMRYETAKATYARMAQRSCRALIC